jgi:hypothetical protein
MYNIIDQALFYTLHIHLLVNFLCLACFHVSLFHRRRFTCFKFIQIFFQTTNLMRKCMHITQRRRSFRSVIYAYYATRSVFYASAQFSKYLNLIISK